MSSSIEIKGLDQEAYYFGPPTLLALGKGQKYDQGAIYDYEATRKAIETGLSFLDSTVIFSSHLNFFASCFCFFPFIFPCNFDLKTLE